MTKLITRALPALVVACLALPSLAAPAVKRFQPDEQDVEVCRRVARQLPREHLLRAPMDNTISSRAWTNYISLLDFEHAYFTREDVEAFRASETLLDDQLKEGDTRFALSVYTTLVQRVDDRVRFVTALLATNIDLSADETYDWNRRDARWVHAGREWDDLWRRKVKNEYLRLLISREARKDAPAPTNAPHADADADEDGEPADDPRLQPAEQIRKRYEQLQIVIHDNDMDWILQNYLNAFTQAYDPHSGYLSPSAMEDFDIEMRLSLVGIGALLNSEDGAAKIVSLIPGGPADRDTRDIRLRPGDKIIAVAQGDKPEVTVLHWPLHKVVRLIRGEKGTTVVLTVIPASDPTGTSTRRIGLVRDEVKLEEQAASGEVQTVAGADGEKRKLGIVRLPTFYANMKVAESDHPEYKSAADDVLAIIRKQKEEGVQGILLDLRSDGGGSLREAIRLAGLFVTEGPIVQVRERFIVRVLPDDDAAAEYMGPLVVLVNRLSASASEIVAGALQDYRRAIIVGDSKTHGKGTVQTVLEMGQGPRGSLGSLKVTTASYYRISGGSTQLRGIIPDIVLPSPWDFMDTGEEKLRNAMPWSVVRPADFEPAGDVDRRVNRLRAMSERRRATDASFMTYTTMLQKLAKINETKVLPLNIDKRRTFAGIEKEMTDLQERLASQVEGGKKKSKSDGDVVLAEAMRILADLAALQGPVALHPPAPVGPLRSLSRNGGS